MNLDKYTRTLSKPSTTKAIAIVGGVVAAVGLGYLVLRPRTAKAASTTSGGSGKPPMAKGDPNPKWPLPANARPGEIRKSRQFGVRRKSTSKAYHVGIDLGSRLGDPVLAPESGKVVGIQTFNGPGQWALLIETDTGLVINLGEVWPDSIKVGRGQRVKKGQHVADVGDSNMLHIETYRPGTRVNKRWYVGQPPPPELLDPTNYVAAMR